ncbi:hypothetical protein HETIRDRAFT_385327, partial [Heterobasidion irregulare TC 32-1]
MSSQGTVEARQILINMSAKRFTLTAWAQPKRFLLDIYGDSGLKESHRLEHCEQYHVIVYCELASSPVQSLSHRGKGRSTGEARKSECSRCP